MSQNLAWTEMASDSEDKEGIFNDSLSAIDAGMTSQYVVTWVSGNTSVTPGPNNWQGSYEVRVNPDGGSPPTGAETLTIAITHIVQKPFIVTNNTLGNVQVGAGGFIVAAGEKKSFYYNGSAVVQVSGARDNLLKASVRVAHGSNVTISTALNNGDSLSGVTLATGDRVLLYGQTDPKENGIYSVAASPSRSDDADEDGEILPGTQVYVRAGTNAGKLFFCTNASTPDIGVDNITWDDVGSGLTGSYLKLDGSTTMTGAIKAAAGSLGSPSVTFGGDTNTGWDNVAADTIRTQCGGAEVSRITSTGINYGGGTTPVEAIEVVRTGATTARMIIQSEGNNGVICGRYTNSTTNQATSGFRRYGGTIASPAIIPGSSAVGKWNVQLWDGTQLVTAASLAWSCVEASPSTSALGTRLVINTTLASAATETERVRFDDSGFSMEGANPVIDRNRIFRPRSYTKATLPSVTTTGLIYCSDEDGGGCLLYSDGSNWRRVWDGKVSGTTNKKKQTIYVPAGAMSPNTTNGATALATLETSSNKLCASYLSFPDGATTKYASFNVVMPKSWDEGTITFIPHWMHPSTTTNFGVVWQLRAVAISDTDAMDAAFGTA